VESFTKLIALVEKNVAKIKETFPDADKLLNNQRRAKWQVELSKKLVAKLDFSNAGNHLRKALTLLDYQWPEDPKVVQKLLNRGLLIQLKHYIIHPKKGNTKTVTDQNLLQAESLKLEAFATMVEAMYSERNINRHQYYLAIVEFANLAAVHTGDNPIAFVKNYIILHFSLYWESPFLASFYHNNLQDLLRSLPSTQHSLLYSQYLRLGLVEFAKGSPETAASFINSYIENRTAKSDLIGTYQGYLQITIINFMRCEHSPSIIEKILTHFQQILNANLWHAWAPAASILGISDLLAGRIEPAQKWIELLNANMDQVPDQWGFMIAIFEMVKFVKYAIGGSITEALDSFIAFGKSAERVEMFIPIISMSSITIPFIMLTAIFKGGGGGNSVNGFVPLTTAQNAKLVEAFEYMVRTNRRQMKETHSVLNVWGLAISETTMKYLKDPHMSTHHFQALKNMLCKKHLMDQLEKFCLIKGLVFGLLSKTAKDAVERKAYGQAAVEVFASPRLKVLAEWAKA
jgi:tetratricopeptide (TPR) repeat protein